MWTGRRLSLWRRMGRLLREFLYLIFRNLVVVADGLNGRYSIREGHLKRAVGERMKVFEEFVSLFDDQDYEEE